MSSTHRSTWKRREREAARLFGAERQPLSGSSGRADRTRSDSTHPKLYIETKLKASLAVRTLWEDTASKAQREGKTPILVLYGKGKPGGLVVCHERHLAELAELVAAIGEAPIKAPIPTPAYPSETEKNGKGRPRPITARSESAVKRTPTNPAG